MLQMDPDTRFYGEGYSKLSQYGGTLAEPVDIGAYNDRLHYRLPQADGFFTAYNMMMFFPENREIILMAFSSCRRFSGEFRISPLELEVVLDMEGLWLQPGEKWELEEFFIETGSDRERLLDLLGGRLQENHPRPVVPEVPVGWCSWYCYGPEVTEKDIIANMRRSAAVVPALKYIQIDDGYQSRMGDWLVPGDGFSDGIAALCNRICGDGFEPAVWVAPFIAEQGSLLFREHPGWFVMDEAGLPLSSADVSFGGWRNGPWYMLDGTHPDARAYLRTVFGTMRKQWNCRYFKLDANMWGAMPFGVRHMKTATRVEAYRLGMKAVMEGAGEDSFILGCNAPMWPSIGAVHGMRITNDISRNWPDIRANAMECFWRNWQHGRLWMNDPDCLVLENSHSAVMGPDGQPIGTNAAAVTEDEFLFHAAGILASGGSLLSGDDISIMSDASLGILKKMIPPTSVSAKFDDVSFRIGRIRLGDRDILAIFNREDVAASMDVSLESPCRIEDFWTGRDLGEFEREFRVEEMNPHSARLLVVHRR
jgi:alpha-galactosidase